MISTPYSRGVQIPIKNRGEAGWVVESSYLETVVSNVSGGESDKGINYDPFYKEKALPTSLPKS